MFSFFKQKNIDIPKLTTDVHSHLIAGIDDGARDMNESLTLLRGLVSSGYKKIIITPHINEDRYPNKKKDILHKLEILKKEVKKENINVILEVGAEYYLDATFLSSLRKGDILTLGDKYILFETSFLAKPLQFDEIIYEIKTAGYKPLLAHPERYQYIKNYEVEFSILKEKGIYFQVNINSFGGYYGKEAKDKVEFLSNYGMIDFLGSDLHRFEQIDTLNKIKNKKIYKKIYKNNIILNNLI